MKLEKYKTATILTFISLALLIAVNGVFIITTSYFLKKEALEVAKEKADLILDKNLSVHDYFTNKLKPALLDILNDSIKSGSYFDPAWMSSSFAIKNLDKYFQQRNKFGYYYKDASINARNSNNEADSIEISYIRQLNKYVNTPPKDGIIIIDEKKYYYVLKKGEVLEKNCLKCHSSPQSAPKKLVSLYGDTKSFNRKLGDVISAVSIRIPLDEAYARANHTIFLISLTISFIVLLMVVSYIYLQKKLIFKPLSVLRRQAIAISLDNSHLGETIKVATTKDLTDFVKSFNIMSEKIHDYNMLLEDKVKEKTFHLESKIKDVEQLVKDKDRFLTILAHDLKNPFASLLGFLNLLKDNIRKYDIDKIERQLNMANYSALNIYELFEDLLVWGNSQSGKLPFEPEIHNLKETCNLVLEHLKDIANAKNIEIKCLVLDNIAVWADLNMIRTILRNLVSNGIKFTNVNGQLIIKAEKTDKATKISVIDNGIGISKESLDNLWLTAEKYTTIGTANEKGTGLGLSICKDFIEKHGGKIWAESEVGKGSNFMFTIPD